MAKKPRQETEEELESSSVETASDETATDAAFADDDYVVPDAGADRKPSRLPALLSFVALGIAAAALFAVFYLTSAPASDQTLANEANAKLATLSATLAATETSLREVQSQLQTLSGNRGTSAAEFTALEGRLDHRLRALDPIPGRLLRLEKSFTALQGISTGVQDTWLLAETEYYLQIGNAQLQLAGNPHLATLALRLADERLLQLADPALTDVRRVLADELQSLELLEKPDIEGATLTLASLANVIESLPLRQEVEASHSEAGKPDAELTGVDRALASLKGAVGDVVTIRRTDEAIRPLIAPEAIYFLRANLALQLQTARLALLRSEQAVFQQSLDDAVLWLEEYYDLQSTPVRSALQTIREIRDSSFVTAVPDISESLRLLRQHTAFSQALDATDVETDVEPQ
jgi:uroporphyrin-3 C-methyltransferase